MASHSSQQAPRHVTEWREQLKQQKGVESAQQINHQIMSCQSWRDLRNVFSRHQGRLNHIHAAALMAGLAKTAPVGRVSALEERREFEVLAAAVLAVAASQASRCALRYRRTCMQRC